MTDETVAILQLAYDKKYVLKIEDACLIAKTLMSSFYICEDYKETYIKASDSTNSISITFTTLQAIKAKILEKSLENDNAKS